MTDVSFVSLQQVLCQFLLLAPPGQLASPWLLRPAFISLPPSFLPFPVAPGDLSPPTHSSPPVTHPDPTLQGAPNCCRQSSLGQILPLRLRPPPPLRPKVPCAAHPNYRPPSKEIKRDAAAVTMVSGSRLPGSATGPLPDGAPCLKTLPPRAPAAVPSSFHQPAASQREETPAQPPAASTPSRGCRRLPLAGPGGRPRRESRPAPPRCHPAFPAGPPEGLRGAVHRVAASGGRGGAAGGAGRGGLRAVPLRAAARWCWPAGELRARCLNLLLLQRAGAGITGAALRASKCGAVGAAASSRAAQDWAASRATCDPGEGPCGEGRRDTPGAPDPSG